MEEKYYLKIGKASDLKSSKDRAFFRFLEMLPGLLSWGMIILMIFLSWQKPVWVAIFIIFFDIFWLFRTIYLSFHLWAGYRRMIEYEKVDWIEKLENLQGKNWKEFYHLVVFPMYKESFEIIRDSLVTLEKSDYPKEKMIVVLGCEERARKEVEKTVELIRKGFENKFFKFLVTWHPDLEGEIAGKGSNETWAARKAKKEIIDKSGIPYEKVIFSSFDVDTCIYPKYFSCLTYHYLTVNNPMRKSFQPVPLFMNNIWQAPAFSRIFSFSSSFWHTMNQERPEKLVTFSSHSMSFKTLVDVGFKQVNVVSDDSRIFWQCFLKFDGDYQACPIYYPISMDANVAGTFWKTLVNIYKQQRRWAYGVGDIAYFLFGFSKNKKIPLSKKISLGWESLWGHWSWADSSILIFLLGWLPVVLGGNAFSQALVSYNLPKITSQILTISMIGLIISAYFSLIILRKSQEKQNRFKYIMLILEWFLVPFGMIFFTSLPALDAQTRWMIGKYMGFWPTEKVRKRREV